FPGTEAPRTEGYGVVGCTPGEGAPALVLQGHVDVVPTGDLDNWPGRNAFSGDVADGILFGRGACDMKAGVAVNLEVARAIQRSGVTLERRLAVHSVVSEEDGGLGAFATLVRGHGGEAAVITEPTSRRILVANAGALTFELRVFGLAAHGSMRQHGVSAFEAFLPVQAAIVVLETERNAHPSELFHGNPVPYAISIGRVRAGDWASSVPDLLVAEGRLGVQLGEEPGVARAAFERSVADACDRDPWLRDHPVEVTWTGGQFASGSIDPDHDLIWQTSDAVAAVTGGAAPPHAAAPYGSDLRLYAGIGGIPTLHYGPGHVRFAHAPSEQVALNEVLESAQAMALLVVRRCGARF
ncbi:MAG: acetylornithine deacetylase, partial [Actinomycetota bacterium]|nr:acetylornithine deacetylase [Actinomycetota bacterium]